MEGARERGNRNTVWVLLLLLLLGAVVAVLLRGGKEPEGDGGQAPAARAEERDLPPARGEAYAVVVGIEATDELPMVIHRRAAPRLADGVALVEEEDLPAYLFLSEEARKALVSGAGDESFEAGARSLDAVDAVLVTEIVYGGRGRHGTARRVVLASELPPYPAAETPDTVRLTPEKGVEALDAVLPLPSLSAWRIEDGSLRAGERTLRPGEEVALPAAERRLKVTERRYRPIPRGPEPRDPFATEEVDLGEVLFRCRVRVRFVGRVKVRVETER